jgi:HipA-like protein
MAQRYPVGQLNLTRNDGCEFRLLESYKNAYPRPILGQQFLDDPDLVHSSRQRTPPWFSNLLPEGPLRDLIARQAGVSVYREFFLLHHLGEDLPGAVRIVADEAIPEPAGAEPAGDRRAPAQGRLAFLAGRSATQVFGPARRTRNDHPGQRNRRRLDRQVAGQPFSGMYRRTSLQRCAGQRPAASLFRKSS